VGTLFADRARGRIGAFWVMAANLRLCFLQRLGCIRSVLRRNVLGMGMEFIWKKRQKVKTECGNVVQIVENKKKSKNCWLRGLGITIFYITDALGGRARGKCTSKVQRAIVSYS
jgi:hypothetical protein